MPLVKGTNSFITVAEADSYFLDTLQNDSWSALTDTVKSQALISAASQINLKLDDDFKFPVSEPSEINSFLSLANAQLGLYFALSPANVTSSGTGSNLKSGGAGSAKVEFFRPEKGSRFPTLVNEFLRESGTLGSANSSTVAGAISTGTCDKSTFSNIDRYGVNDGYS